MNTPSFHRRSPRGSALVTVVMFIGIMAVLTASVLKYSISERRANERQRMVFRSRNMAENVTLYAAEQLTTKLYRLRSFTPMAFMSGTNQIYLPPDSVLTTQYSSPSDMEVRAGLTTSTGLTYIDPTLTANANNPNAGLSVSTSTIPIIAKATMTHPQLGGITAYCENDLEIAMIPIFQFAMFYNMDLEIGPGADMVISGPVHVNGSLIARDQTGFATKVEFTERVTASGGFYADTAHKGPMRDSTGGVDSGPGGTGPLYFTKPNLPPTDIKSPTGIWRDHKYGTSSETTTTLSQFKTFATSNYAGNLRTSIHGVTKLVLPDVADYAETDDPSTTADERDNGRQVLEPPATTDTAGLQETKFARKAGLYIIVNPDDKTRTGILPDATTVSMRARSYRCFLNTINADLTHTIREIVLPGQPSYGSNNTIQNNLPNAYTTTTSIRHNQVLRIAQNAADAAGTGYDPGAAAPTMASFGDAYFFDLRRATNNSGYPYSRATNPYTPRPIAKIDFDFTRFRMAVERSLIGNTTASIYYPSQPRDAWANSILNPATTTVPASFGLGVGSPTTLGGAAYNTFPTAGAVTAIQKSAAAVYTPGTITLRGSTQTGTGAVTDYAGRFTIEDTPDDIAWTVRYTSVSDEVSKAYTPNAGIKTLRVRLYLAGGTTTKLDEELISVVTDGTVTCTGVLTNNYLIVPSNAAGAGPLFTNAFTEMYVFNGAVDDTANWTFTAAPSTGLTGSFGTGRNANSYFVTGMTSATTSTVGITASRTGYTSITKTMTLEKQSNIAAAASPLQTGRWFTVTRDPGPDPFRIYYATAPADPPESVPVSAFASTIGPSPWYDGITIYIHSVDAEVRSQVVNATANPPTPRIDSGVRLWNGRGPLVSLSSVTFPGRSGLSLATNDAVYIVGHFNADGTVNATATSTGLGGYSGRYPDSANEKLVAVMGDAVTILSQPEFDGTTFTQNLGWSDSLSAHRRDSGSGWNSAWQTTNPSSSNNKDGVDTSISPAAMPNLGNTVAGAGAAATCKFAPAETEISTCLLVGIVPTNHNPTGLTDGAPSAAGNGQTSGGAHNYPRLLETWGGAVGLYIRGSMVAMFESRVAMEPWSLRIYTGAKRYWGLHESLRNANHDLPLEPMLLNGRRKLFKEINAAEYSTLKTTIEALPH